MDKRSDLGNFLFDTLAIANRVHLAGMSSALLLRERTAEDPRLALDTPPLILDADKVESSGNNIIERKIMEAIEAVDAVSDPEEERFQNAVSDARAAFWAQLKTHYPEIPNTSVMSDRDIEARFEIATEGAADAWVTENTGKWNRPGHHPGCGLGHHSPGTACIIDPDYVQVLDSKGGDA